MTKPHRKGTSGGKAEALQRQARFREPGCAVIRSQSCCHSGEASGRTYSSQPQPRWTSLSARCSAGVRADSLAGFGYRTFQQM